MISTGYELVQKALVWVVTSHQIYHIPQAAQHWAASLWREPCKVARPEGAKIDCESGCSFNSGVIGSRIPGFEGCRNQSNRRLQKCILGSFGDRLQETIALSPTQTPRVDSEAPLEIRRSFALARQARLDFASFGKLIAVNSHVPLHAPRPRPL